MKIAIILYALMACNSAFEYRTGDPVSLFPVQGAVHDCSSPVIMMTPALLPFSDGLILSSNAGRPYSDKDLITGGSALQYGDDGYGFQLSWNSFGADFYREHTFSLKAGYSICPYVHAGIAENLFVMKIATSELSSDRKTADTDFAVILTPFSWINAGFIQTGIVSMINKQSSDMLYAERSGGIILKPGKGISLSWNLTETAVEKVNIFTTTVNPASFLSVSAGYCKENSSMAASIGILAKNFFVTYGLKYHPYLGYTHSLGITFTLSSGIESLDYGKPVFSSLKKKINTRTATNEELRSIDGLSEKSAERIIQYREKIGPVTEKALMQIGLTNEEIDIFETNVYGLERVHRNKEGEKSFRKINKKPPRRERIKSKFRKLIDGGISSYTAITYSELSESADGDEFQKKLYNDASLNDGQKKLIEKTCND